MASNFVKQFAIDNQLTVDYGYTFGKYRDFYISIKEGVTYRILQIITKIGNEKDNLKEILKSFNNDLEKFCVNDFKFEKDYIEFTFNLNSEKSNLVIDFLNRYIDEFEKLGYKKETCCPICNKFLKDTEEIEIINYRGIISPAHKSCFKVGKEKIEEKVKKDIAKDNEGKTYLKGLLGAILFSIIYIAIVIGAYCLIIKGIEALSSSESSTPEGVSQNVFQYLPVLICLGSVPLISAGYEIFKGKKGTHKYLIVLILSFVSSLIAIVFGIFLSFVLVASGTEGMSFGELFTAVFEIMYVYDSTRFMLFFSIGLSMLFTAISIAFKFGSYKEIKDSQVDTIEKM